MDGDFSGLYSEFEAMPRGYLRFPYFYGVVWLVFAAVQR